MILKKFGNIYISFPDERIMQDVLRLAELRPEDLESVDEPKRESHRDQQGSSLNSG
ncbi:MAG: hypothetical protein RXR08_10660 [Sulfolobaceae archaeon]